MVDKSPIYCRATARDKYPLALTVPTMANLRFHNLPHVNAFYGGRNKGTKAHGEQANSRQEGLKEGTTEQQQTNPKNPQHLHNISNFFWFSAV